MHEDIATPTTLRMFGACTIIAAAVAHSIPDTRGISVAHVSHFIRSAALGILGKELLPCAI